MPWFVCLDGWGIFETGLEECTELELVCGPGVVPGIAALDE